MVLFAENKDKILGEVLNDLVNSTVVSRTSPGSKMRALAESFSRKMGRMYSTFDLNFGQAFLDGADGQYLEFIGDMMGVGKLGEQAARVTANDRNVRFSVDAGTFGDINGGAPITVIAGTIISTRSGGAGILYRVLVDTVLLAADDEAFVSVQAVRTGALQNIGAGELRFHDFNGYADVANLSLKVTNVADVITGGDLETDTNYRFRISNQVLAAEQANPTAIRIAALLVPGVADITIIPFNRGIGTYDLLIKSVNPNITQSLLDNISASVGQVTSQGIVGRIKGPSELGLSVVGSLQYRRILSTQEENTILTAAITNVTDYVNNLDIGEEFIVQEALERVLTTSDLIKKVGSTSKPFDNLFIYRPSRLEDNKVRSTLIDDFDPEVDERIIVENRFAGAIPILFRSA